MDRLQSHVVLYLESHKVWIKKKPQDMQEYRGTRPKKRRRAGAKSEKDDALIIETEESKLMDSS